ncbi:MAG: NADP oxidoreductase [Anaerolineae bacterium]|nr:NADP oxidoreductase [Anaerolineae bacterium]
MTKPKVASDWLAGCSGCHMSLLDMDERLLDIIDLVDLRATPITDLKHPDKDGVDVGILEGGINNSANLAVAKMMRERCKILVALGDCAVFGGVPAMRNFFDLDETVRYVYTQTMSMDKEAIVPKDPELAVPQRVQALSEVIKVDVFVPGCPPSPDAIYHVLSELAQGRLPNLTGNLLDWH